VASRRTPSRLVPGGGGDEQTASDGRRTYRPPDDEPARLDADDANCWRDGPAGRPPIGGGKWWQVVLSRRMVRKVAESGVTPVVVAVAVRRR
jgi:hypothetical protein